MKKIMLGVLALSQVASLIGGYVKTNNSISIKYEKTKEEKTLEVKPNVEVGVYYGKNKDGFLFIGGDFKYKEKLGVPIKYEEDGYIEKNYEKNLKYYLGTRLDSKITEDANLKVLFLYDKLDSKDREKKHKELLKHHLTLLGKYKDDEEALYLNGYKLFNKENNLMLSGVLDGKYDETIDYNLGFIYGSNNFEDATFESFLKAKAKFEKYEIAGNVTSTLGTYKRWLLRPGRFENFKEDKLLSKGNLENGGKLKADVTISSDKLAKGLNLKAKAYTDLDTVIPDKVNHLIKGGLETEAKYNKQNLELLGQLNYRFELVKENELQDLKSFGIASFLLHKPEVVVGLKYDNKKTLFETKLSNEVFVNHDLRTKEAMVELEKELTKSEEERKVAVDKIMKSDDEKQKNAISSSGEEHLKKENEEIKNQDQLRYVSNIFRTSNKLETNVSKAVKLGLIGNYELKVKNLEKNKYIGGLDLQGKFENRLVVGPHLNINVEKENSKFTSNNKLRYGLELATGMKDKNKLEDRKHEVVLISETEAKIKKGNFTITPKLDLVNVLRFDKKFEPIKETKYGYSLDEKEQTKDKIFKQFAKPNITPREWILLGYADVEAMLNLMYEKDRLSLTTELKDNLHILYAFDKEQFDIKTYDRNKNMFQGLDSVIVNKVKLSTELGYKVVDNAKLITGLSVEHDYTNATNKPEITSFKTAEKIKKDIKKYDDVKEDTLTEKASKHIKETKDDDKFKGHKVTVNPYVGSKLTFLDSKLVFEPKAEVKYSFEETDKKHTVEGIFNLKLEYNW